MTITASKVGRDVRKGLSADRKHIITHVTALDDKVVVLLVHDRYTDLVERLLQEAGYTTEKHFERVDVMTGEKN